MPPTSSPRALVAPRRLGSRLTRWFGQQKRPLPWRAARDPYRTWIAEVLLQQTRVDQAIPYFERFVARFPDLRSLAGARREEVLKLWQGAGYYARARHLHEAAEVMVVRHRSSVPGTVEELEALPGVGPYTARAVAALAFGVRVVPVDANVLRVAARWTLETRDVRRPAVRATLEGFLERAMPPDQSGPFAEALMELGETVCRPKSPRCGRCPVAFGCRAAQELADPGALPRRGTRPARPHVRGAVVAVERENRWLVQRRPESGLLGGLWEFPGGKIEPGESPVAAARRELLEETGVRSGPLRPVTVVRHAYSHFTVELHLFRGRARSAPRAGGPRRWATLEEIAALPLPRATEKMLAALSGGRLAAGGRGPGPEASAAKGGR